MLAIYLVSMVLLAWLTVFTGAFIVYPWYRAVPPAGISDLTEFPRRLLLSSGRTSEWHNVGMEWKENVAWIAPLAMTMVAYVTLKYRQSIALSRQMRTAVLGLTCAASISTGARRGVWRLPQQVCAGSRRFGDHPDGGREVSGHSNDGHTLPNGPAAAAILATGIGCAALGVLAFRPTRLP